jgi:hypothetical protein
MSITYYLLGCRLSACIAVTAFVIGSFESPLTVFYALKDCVTQTWLTRMSAITRMQDSVFKFSKIFRGLHANS